MFKIGEFSKITQVSVRMLRYYDEHKLLIPCFIEQNNGYRLYSAEQIDELNKIVLLRNMGFGVKEIKEMLLSWSPEILKDRLLEQVKRTEESIKVETNRLQQIQGYLSDLDNQQKNVHIQIVIRQLPIQHVVSLRKIVPDYYCEGMMWQEFYEALRPAGNLDRFESFALYHDLDYREKEVDIEICMVMNEPSIEINETLIYRQVGQVDMAASFMVYGPYSNISIAYKEFAFWLEQHSEYSMAGENRQICHISPCDTNNPEEYVTELQIPLIYSQK